MLKIQNGIVLSSGEPDLNAMMKDNLLYDDGVGIVAHYATMMVKMGEADGLVAGSICSTADTLRPALQIIKTKE